MRDALRNLLSLMVLITLTVQHAQAASVPVVLTESGQPRAGILIAPDATDYTRQAADLLQSYLHKMSGAELPIETDVARIAGNRIWIGDHPQQAGLRQREPRVDVTFTRYDEILMYAGDQDIVIRGRDRSVGDREVEVGTFLATQRFITEQLGVRWLWPGELGTDIPRQDTVTIEPFFKQYAPQLSYRRIRGVEYEYRWRNRYQIPGVDDQLAFVQKLDDGVRTWLNRHNIEGRMGGRADGITRPIIGGQNVTPATGHYFSHWYGKYFERHPEWFALQPDGTRGTFPPQTTRVKICVSNPEVLEQYVKEAVDYFERNPSIDVMGIAPNDSGWMGYCVCENCQAWDSPNAPEAEQALVYADELRIRRAAITDRKVRFWNAAARRVQEHFPDRNIQLLSYGYNAYRTPPVDIRLEDNIIIQFEGLLLRHRPLNTDENIARHRELWQGWANQASQILWRPNLRLARPADPYNLVRRYGETVNFLAKHRLTGIDIDTMMTNDWSSHGPQYYLAAVMAWDPHADAGEIMADYYARAFGPAADPIREYYELFENLYEYLAQHYSRWSPHRDILSLYRELRIPPEEPGDTMAFLGISPSELEQENARPIENRAAAYLEEARRRVADADPVYLERVEFVAISWAYTQAHLDLLEAIRLLRRSPDDPELNRNANALYEKKQKILLDNFDNYALNHISDRMYVRHRSYLPSLVPPDYHHRYE